MIMLQHQIIRYGLVGSLSVSVDFAILNIAYLKINLPLYLSVLLGFTASVIIGYFLHSRWTFRYDTKGKEFSKLTSYIFVTVIGLAITEGIVLIATERFGIYYNISKVIAVAFAILFTYITSKYWVFQNKTARQTPVDAGDVLGYTQNNSRP